MSRFFFLAMLLLGVTATSSVADALPPDCSHTHDGCTYDWYNDPGNPNQGTLITTCGSDYRDVNTHASGHCGA